MREVACSGAAAVQVPCRAICADLDGACFALRSEEFEGQKENAEGKMHSPAGRLLQLCLPSFHTVLRLATGVYAYAPKAFR